MSKINKKLSSKYSVFAHVTVTVPSRNFDLEIHASCFSHRRRRAERHTRKTGISADWTSCKKVTAALRRHTNRLQRHRLQHQRYSIIQTLLGMPEPQNTLASLAVVNRISLPDVTETLVDVFTSQLPVHQTLTSVLYLWEIHIQLASLSKISV